MFLKKKELEILAPMSGELIGIENVPDTTFSVGTLGKGVAIIPEDGNVYSPVGGIVNSIFPTLHAISITTKEGVEILIHVGIDTVNLGGVGFEAKVSRKAGIRTGTLLLTADIESIKRAGYSIITPIVICNPNECKEIIYRETGKVRKGDVIMRVKL
ncbi:MAG: PTS sugar transporter subunit IIA [Catonella sp.]|uniref:PTS sugar transporter subunit IIA n=1 Tax=Catonella sp. TaxID=2382125 RepID=UPI003FA0B39F